MKAYALHLARLALRLFGVLVIVAVVVYAVVIHPNDARMTFPADGASRPIHDFYECQGTLLVDRMPHALDLTATAFAAKRKALLEALPDYALPASSRFISPYQVYVPVGAYPLKLDAQDGLYVPAGATLTVQPKLVGEFDIRFSVYSPRSAGLLQVGLAGQPAAYEVALPPPPHSLVDFGGKLYSDYVRFLRVDPTDGIEAWHPAHFRAVLPAGSSLAFRCAAGAAYGCIVGDVGFYRRTPRAPESYLIVLVDTLRADAVTMGNAPRMRALTEAGVDFTHALAPGNMTSPSTNAFLSCRLPSQLGELAFSYGVSGDFRDAYYRQNVPSFPARFLAAGYDTAMIGNVSVISEIYGVGIDHGFARQVALETDGYATPAIAREAIHWLQTNGDHPFLLYVHFDGPHAPYRAPFRDIGAAFPGRGAFSSYPDLLRWLYQGKVAYTDRYVGKVLDALQALGLADHTTVVLTADHGEQQTFHRYAGNSAAPDFTGAYFDHGATLLNDEIHVPLAIVRPGVAARRVDEWVSTLDLGPTLLALTGAPVPAACAGASLVPYFGDSAPLGLATRPLASEGFRARMVLLDGRYKYIRTYEPTDKRIYAPFSWSGRPSLYLAPEQLFDLQQDPAEERDLSAAEPARMDAARQVYHQLFGVRDGYELVVESPDGAPYAATWGPGVDIGFEEGEGLVTRTATAVTVTGQGRTRVLMEAKGVTAMPRVTIGGLPVRVAMTSMRLPLQVLPGALAAEPGGRYSLLEPAAEAAAYIRKVEDDGQRNRHLSTGNPAFEKVLREWGYLNDK